MYSIFPEYTLIDRYFKNGRMDNDFVTNYYLMERSKKIFPGMYIGFCSWRDFLTMNTD